MSTITFRRNLDSETLHVPELRSMVGHSVEIIVRDSQPVPGFDADRSALLQKVDELYQQCSQPGWDNEDAEPIGMFF